MTRTQTVVKADTAADLLRLVPVLAGVAVEDSLVLVVFRGRRTAGAMRLDLPRTADPLVLKRWASTAIGTACKLDGVTGVVPVAYTSDPFSPSGRVPAAQVLRAVSRRARQAGLEVKDALCVAADGWGSLHDPALPRGGRPLTEIETMAVDGEPHVPKVVPTAVAASDAAQDRFTDHFLDWWTDPEGPGGVLHGVDLTRHGAAFGPAGRGAPAMERYRFGEDQDQVVELVERMLDRHPEDGGEEPCPCRALLLAIALRPGLPGILLLQFAFGAEFGARLWAASHDGDPDAADAQLLGRAFAGDFRRPDPERLTRAIEVVGETAALVGDGPSAALDALLAWLYWACGSGSIAGRLAERALETDPDQELAQVVRRWADAGHLPEWAFREDPQADPFVLPAA